MTISNSIILLLRRRHGSSHFIISILLLQWCQWLFFCLQLHIIFFFFSKNVHWVSFFLHAYTFKKSKCFFLYPAHSKQCLFVVVFSDISHYFIIAEHWVVTWIGSNCFLFRWPPELGGPLALVWSHESKKVGFVRQGVPKGRGR